MVRGFVVIYLLAGVLIILAVSGIYYLNLGKTISSTSIPAIKSTIKSTPGPTPSPWKTYTNQKYGFELIYPARGVIYGKDNLSEGECGQAIKEEESSILLDNLFKLQIINWQGTLDQYLISQGAKTAYNFQPIDGSGADEAVELKGLKNGYEIAVGYPPLNYITAVYKKGEKIFLFKDLHDEYYTGGCMNTSVVDPVKYEKYVKQGWDLKKSVRFLEAQTQKYTCPLNGWVNCMPILSEEGKKACSKEAVSWYKINCPNFKGVAQ